MIHNLFYIYYLRAISDDEFVPNKKKDSAKRARKEPAAKKGPAAKKAPAAKRAPAKKNNSTTNDNDQLSKKPASITKSEFDDDDDSNDIPISKPERKPRAATTKPKRKISYSEDSDDLFKTATSNSM